METKSFGSETHVAQRRRRDKLRFQQSLTSVQHLEDFNSFDQLAVVPGLTADLVQVRHRNRNMLYDPSLLSSAMLNFATSANVLSAQRDAMVDDQELGPAHPNSPIAAKDSSFTNMSQPVLSSLNASPSASNGEAQGCGNWTKLGSEQSYDLSVDYTGGSVVGTRNQKLVSPVEFLSNKSRVNDVSPYTQLSKPGYNEYRDTELQSSFAYPPDEFSSEDSQKQFKEMQFTSHPLHQNTLQDVVTSGFFGRTKECSLHPSCENQSSTLDFNNVSSWSSELGLITRKSSQELRTIPNEATTQGLSLSLSSNQSSKVDEPQFGEASESGCLESKNDLSKQAHNDSKVSMASYLCPLVRTSILSKGCGDSLHDLPGNDTNILRNTGPLEPFTGYATILNNSRFLKPAQELLDELCSVKGLKLAGTCELPERIGGAASPLALSHAINAADTGDDANIDNNSGASSFTFLRSNEEIGDCGAGNGASESHRPEYQQMKAKLLYLQEEVCRRYKHYHQQMKMVASFFESVAGLSAAAQYISFALKAVSENFMSLKHAISDQLKHVIKVLGEHLFSPNTFGSSTAGSLRYKDQSFLKNKSGVPKVYLEAQEHIWRPQRGLPERAVVILRAWLFDHFLHPYPTDTDKHMLASQTGLSRNQVSNWFINARVRLWKPMVEEIHTLETKGLLENNRSSSGNSGEGPSQPAPDGDQQASKKLRSTNYLPIKQLKCCRNISSPGGGSEDRLDAKQWNQETRLMKKNMPYQKGGSENGGLASVSLTLGLRHGVEMAQHQQLQHNIETLRSDDS